MIPHLVVAILSLGAVFTVAGIWMILTRSKRPYGATRRSRKRPPMRREVKGTACIGFGVLAVSAAMIIGVMPQFFFAGSDPTWEAAPADWTNDPDPGSAPEFDPGPGIDILAPEQGLEQVEPPPDAVEMAPEEIFLALVRDDLPPETSLADVPDEELLEAGAEACSQIGAGSTVGDVALFDGMPQDSLLVANAAVRSLCG